LSIEVLRGKFSPQSNVLCRVVRSGCPLA